jgi:hypothetical protein
MCRVTRSRLVEVIQRALALIVVQETWTRGVLARNAQGTPVSPFAPEAVRFCAIGALRNAAFQIMQGNECAAMQLARAIEFDVFGMGVSLESVNDGGGREAVLALLRKELASATARLAEHRSRALFNAFPPPPPGELKQSAAPATTALATELLI